MSLQGGMGWTANGNVAPCRFVRIDTSGDGLVVECTAVTDIAIGISQEGSLNVPALGLSTAYAATAGIPVKVFEGPEVCLLEVSAAVTRGARLGPSAGDGRGVTAALTNRAFARALQSAGGAGEKILVKLFAGVDENTA